MVSGDAESIFAAPMAASPITCRMRLPIDLARKIRSPGIRYGHPLSQTWNVFTR
jgi:hypothetical protein